VDEGVSELCYLGEFEVDPRAGPQDRTAGKEGGRGLQPVNLIELKRWPPFGLGQIVGKPEVISLIAVLCSP
jgi:hypothetical protein